MVPGRALHRVAKFALARRACEQVVEAQLADFQHEWAAATSVPARALVLLRGYAAFCVVLVSCAVGMSDVSADERRAIRRVFGIGVAGTILSMVCLGIAFLASFPQRTNLDPVRLAEWQRFEWVMFFNFASQLLPLAAAVGLVCGIGLGLQRHASRTSRRVVLGVAAASCVAIFVISSWFLPPAFRMISQSIRGQESAGQPAAATLGQTREAMLRTEHTPTAGPGRKRGAEVEYYQRWSWPFAAFFLGLFSLSLIDRGRLFRIALGLAGCAAYFYMVRNVMQILVWETKLPSVIVAWWPNLAFVVLSIVIMTVSRTRARSA